MPPVAQSAGARRPRAAAWCWKAARRSNAGAVASNLDPKVTFLQPGRRARSATPSFVAAIRHFRIEGTSCKINLALNGLPEFTAYPGAPGPQHRATMHICPEHRLRGARLGRRQVRPPLRAPAARTDHPHHVRPVARAARQAHHGHLPAIRALHAARGHVGRTARAVRRPRDRADRGVRAQHPAASSSTARC